MTTAKRLLIPLTVLAASLGIIAACGDDDGGGDALTPEEYANQFEEISNAAQNDTRNLSDDLSAEEGLSMTADIFDDAANDLGDLGSPPEFSDAHDEFVDATAALADAFRDLADAAGTDAESEAGQALDSALSEWQSACQDVVSAAGDEGVTVAVDCSIGS